MVKSSIDSTVSKGIHSSLIKFQNNIIYTFKDGVYRYEDKSSRFIKDTLLNKLIDKKDFLTGKIIYDQKTNKLFSFSKQNISYLRPDKFSSNSVIIQKGIAENLRKGAVGYENIQNLFEERYLIGTQNGYMVTDLSEETSDNYEVTITSIKNYALNEAHKSLMLHKESLLPFKYDNFVFM